MTISKICFVSRRHMYNFTKYIKPGSTNHFFLKSPVPTQENGYCYLIVCFCVCCIVVFLLFSSYSWCISLSFIVTRICFFSIDLWISNSGILLLYFIYAVNKPCKLTIEDITLTRRNVVFILWICLIVW